MDARARQKALAAMMAVIDAGQPFHTADLTAAAKAAGAGFRAHILANQLTQRLKGQRLISVIARAGNTCTWQKRPEPPAPVPKIHQPHAGGPYDPPAQLEGPNNGLTEMVAEFLWHEIGSGDPTRTLRENTSPMEARGWRSVAGRLLANLFSHGMVGPGGPVDSYAIGWSYAWVYEADNWEIIDSDGGGVALVLNDWDVPLMLAAPRMAEAIRHVLHRAQERGGIKRSDLDALRAALPMEAPGG
jgi:hypothetical protein